MQAITGLLLWMPRRFWNWCLEHGRFVFAIWIALGAFAIWYVTDYRPDESDEILRKLKEFADPSLPSFVAFGAVVVVGGLGLLRSYTSSSFAEGVADELSDAATNFAAICCVLFALQFVLQKPIEVSSLRAPFAALIVAIVLCKFRPREEPRVKSVAEAIVEVQEPSKSAESIAAPIDYCLAFTYPAENAAVGESTLLRGTAKIEPSDGSEIWLFRRWGGHDFECYPLARIILVPAPDGSTFEWTAPPNEGYVGGRPGIGEERRFELWLVGPEGMRVVRHFKKWERYLDSLREPVQLLHDEVNDRRKELEVTPLKTEINLVSRAIDVKDIPRDTTCKAHRVVVRA